jgi:DNA-binding transcriptional MerR regulator
MNLLTLKEVIGRSKEKGVEITRRTFEFYQKIGLLPPPMQKIKGKGGRGVYGVYDEQIVQLIGLINECQREGMTLYDIQKSGDAGPINKYMAVLNAWGFKDYVLSKLKGFQYSIKLDKKVEREIFKDWYVKKYQKEPPKKVIEHFAETQTLDSKWKDKILKDLRWASEEQIELYALRHIDDEIINVIGAFSMSIGLILSKGIESEEERNTFSNIILRVKEHHVNELIELREKVLKRIKEIEGFKETLGTEA